jgi:hypothetical protein
MFARIALDNEDSFILGWSCESHRIRFHSRWVLKKHDHVEARQPLGISMLVHAFRGRDVLKLELSLGLVLEINAFNKVEHTDSP